MNKTAKEILVDKIGSSVVFEYSGDITILSNGLNAKSIIEAMEEYANQKKNEWQREAAEKAIEEFFQNTSALQKDIHKYLDQNYPVK